MIQQPIDSRFAGIVGRFKGLPLSIRKLSERPGGFLALLYLATLGWIALWVEYDVGLSFPSTMGCAGSSDTSNLPAHDASVQDRSCLAGERTSEGPDSTTRPRWKAEANTQLTRMFRAGQA